MCVPVRPKIHILPQVSPVPFDEFVRDYPTRSIAGDGFCSGGLTQHHFDEHGGSWLSLDHHGPQAALLLRTTAEQTHDVVMNDGYFRRFIDERGVFAPQVFVSHPDEDVCCMIWLIQNAARVREERLPRLETLLLVGGRMDATAGTYRFPPGYDAKLLRVNYVFEPYRRFKCGGGLGRKKPKEYTAVVRAVCERITEFVDGGLHELAFDTRHEVLDRGPSWKMIREIGLHARREIFLDPKLDGFISVDELGSGRYRYILGARNSWGPFKPSAFGEYMNQIEGCTVDRWGGNDTIWGSPQVAGSPTPPKELQKLALEFHARLKK